MFDNVLVGVDGRSGGRDAIALAARLSPPQAKLTLGHVHGGELHPVHAITPGLVAHEREACEALLEQERDAAELGPERDVQLVSVVAMSAGRGLHQQAEQLGADLLVVGSCGYGAFGRAMLGDDTRAALNGAPCAVAIAARGFADSPPAAGPITRIGVAYNESAEAQGALALAHTLAEPTHSRVQVLEVVSIPTYAFTGLMPVAVGESIEVILAEANARIGALGDVDGRAVYGIPGEELAAFGDQLDILVVGSRGYGAARRLVLGSTSNYLERHARCSLLVLPRSAQAQDGGEDRGEPESTSQPRTTATAA